MTSGEHSRVFKFEPTEGSLHCRVDLCPDGPSSTKPDPFSRVRNYSPRGPKLKTP